MNLKDNNKPMISLIFWGGITMEECTLIILLERDMQSHHQGYLAWSYQKALKQGLYPTYNGTIYFQ